jgi:hypothetical protein
MPSNTPVDWTTAPPHAREILATWPIEGTHLWSNVWDVLNRPLGTLPVLEFLAAFDWLLDSGLIRTDAFYHRNGDPPAGEGGHV